MKNPILEDANDGVPRDTVDEAPLPPGEQAAGVAAGLSRKGVWRFHGAAGRAPGNPVGNDTGSAGDSGGNGSLANIASQPEEQVPVPAPIASELVEAAPLPQPEPQMPAMAVKDAPRADEPPPPDVTTVTAYDFTPRADLLVSDRDANPFSAERTWLDRWGSRSLVVGLGVGTLALALAWVLWPGANEQTSNSVAVLGTKAQVAAIVKPVSPPSVAVPPPEAVVSPVAVPERAVVPAPPLVTLKPDELKEVEPVVEEAAQPVMAPKPAAKPRRARTVVPKTVSKPVRIAAKAVPKPVRKVAKARAPVRAAPKPQVRAAALPAAAPVSARAQLLKACRAYGYHAELCIQRGCKLTKFGLACTGK